MSSRWRTEEVLQMARQDALEAITRLYSVRDACDPERWQGAIEMNPRDRLIPELVDATHKPETMSALCRRVADRVNRRK